MPIKLSFQEVTIKLAEKTIPDHCHNCGTDLREPGNLIEGGYTYYNCRGHAEVKGSDLSFEGEGRSDFMYDEIHPIGYRCGVCDATLAGEGIE